MVEGRSWAGRSCRYDFHFSLATTFLLDKYDLEWYFLLKAYEPADESRLVGLICF